MYTTEMRTTQHRCPNCYTTCPTQKIFNLHTTMCKFIHTSSYEHSIDKYYTNIELPSQESMIHYLFHLTHKYQELEQKMTKLQQSIIPLRKKQIGEYLKQLPAPDQSYFDWIQTIEITDEALETVFKHDLKTAIKNVLESILSKPQDEQLPISAFSQKPNTFYLYDNTKEWRQMSADEFVKCIEKIEHKFLRKYASWVTEHYDELHVSQQAEEKKMVYMAKVNGVKQPNRISELKKWLYSMLAVQLQKYIV